jgi:hypothetical protein
LFKLRTSGWENRSRLCFVRNAKYAVTQLVKAPKI